jgi:hypothetical protein
MPESRRLDPAGSLAGKCLRVVHGACRGQGCSSEGCEYGFVWRPTYAIGEQSDDFLDVRSMHRDRILALVRVVRSPENSAPTAELLNLVEASFS